MSATKLARRINAALGDAPLDLVVRGGRVVNVFTGDVEDADIAVSGDTIVAVGHIAQEFARTARRRLDWSDRWIIPGLIDPHFHMGGSQLSMSEWSRALLKSGTTTVATDVAEIYSYAGIAGVRAALRDAEEAGLRVWFLPPIHLFGIERQGSFRHPPAASELERSLDWPETVGVNEPPPSEVLGKNRDVLRLIASASDRGQVFAGHLPGVSKVELQAYAAAGATSCHESTNANEALEKMAVGIWPMLRFGSAGPDLPELLPLLSMNAQAARWSMFCTDDQDPISLLEDGNVNLKLRLAVDAGIDPAVAVAMATINPASYYGRAHRYGAIAPGRAADLVGVEDLKAFTVTDVVAGGSEVVRHTRLTRARPRVKPVGRSLRSTVRWRRPVRASDLSLPARGARVRARVIGVQDGTLLSTRQEQVLDVVAGTVRSDPASDVLKVAVIDRNSGHLQVGNAFVAGLGLVDGAVATTYCHSLQNMLVVGTSDEQMVRAANTVAEMGGGIAVVQGGRVTTRWALPLIGVFSDKKHTKVAADLARTNEAIRHIGCSFASPVLSLAFVALTTIPSYGLTERGLYDVDDEAFLPVVLHHSSDEESPR